MKLLSTKCKKLSRYLISALTFIVCIALFSETVYAADTLENVHWNKSNATWHEAYTSSSEVTYRIELYRVVDGGDDILSSVITLENVPIENSHYDFRDYIRAFMLDNQLQSTNFKFRVNFYDPGKDETSDWAWVKQVNLDS